MSFAATQMHLEIIILSEVRKREIAYIISMWNLKYDTNELIYGIERLMDGREQTCIPRGRDGERDRLGVWD